MEDVTLTTSVQELQGVGKRYAERLERLGLETVRDVLFHLPRRYEDFSDTQTIDAITVGQTVTVQGVVASISTRRVRGKRLTITEAGVEDETGGVRAVWFNQPYLKRTLSEGTRVSIAGEVSVDHDGKVFSNPSYEKLGRGGGQRHTGRLVPVYPETRGLTSRFLRFLVEGVLGVTNSVEDPLPQETRDRHDLPALSDALRAVHRPADEREAERARRRLAFEELVLLQLHLVQEQHKRKKRPGITIPFSEERTKEFVESLPFALTDAQRRCAWEMIRDMEQGEPMARLLEGDVGSGKTVVAVLAALQVVCAGHQVAVMAPTEMLAAQHFQELRTLLKETSVNIALLTGNHTQMDDEHHKRSTIHTAIADGTVDLVVGTHTLIQKGVTFRKLALAIVDEQHRFGVRQRAKLIDRKTTQNDPHDSAPTPHLLSMTATPIPRTLALTLYGDLDLSVIDEMPAGRKPIDTRIVPPAEREDVYAFIDQELAAGRQAFVICPLIEDSEALEARSVEEEYAKLTEDVFPNRTVVMVHGQMAPAEKEEAMERFVAGDADILVSTSVVEVGIDVPNATVMMIEGSERFGLAQLHQFRGRVGRSEHQSYCFLLTDSAGKRTQARLKAIRDARNGFDLAEKDLHIRGPGQFLGTQQSGVPDLAMASLKDVPLVQDARAEAEHLIAEDDTLESWPRLQRAVEAFEARIHPE